MFIATFDAGSLRLKVIIIGKILLQSNLFVDINIHTFAWTAYESQIISSVGDLFCLQHIKIATPFSPLNLVCG
jgi:hypothetical protein